MCDGAQVYSATTQSQKEKYESDLKKEIKKLQRLRDSIKTWASSSDVKDKRQLMEYRRVWPRPHCCPAVREPPPRARVADACRPPCVVPQIIESKMEQFKVCEKETKTKAFSKEGLAQANRLDPAEKRKRQQRRWLQDRIRDLNEQLEGAEADLEAAVSSGRGRRRDNNSVDVRAAVCCARCPPPHPGCTRAVRVLT